MLECYILYVIVLLATVSNALLLAMYNICLKIEIEACFRRMPLCSILGFFGEYLRAVIGTMMEKLKETWRALINVRVYLCTMSQIWCTVD